MDIYIITAALGVFIFLLTSFGFRKGKKQEYKDIDAILGEIQRSLKLKKSRIGLILSGQVNECEVKIRNYFNIKKVQFYIMHKIAVEGYIKIRSAYINDSDDNYVHSETGDPGFDRKVWTESEGKFQLTHLNKKVRDSLVELADRSIDFEISNSWIKASAAYSVIESRQWLQSSIETLVNLSNDLTREIPETKRIIENIGSESISSILIKNIHHVKTQFPPDRDIELALEKCLENNSLKVQVEAARYLGDKGMEHLKNLLMDWKSMNVSLLENIIFILGANRHVSSSKRLIEVIAECEKESVIRIALQALYKLEDRNMSSFLVKGLKSCPSSLRLNYIETLGTCGVVDAVEELYRLGKSSMNPFMRNAIQKSIARIQSGLGEVEQGWLTIDGSDEQGGGLSISDDAGDGALTLEEDVNNGDDKLK